MAKIINNFYKDGIVGANIDREIHDLPFEETVTTSDNFAEGIKKIFSQLTIEQDGLSRDDIDVPVEDLKPKVADEVNEEYVEEPKEEEIE